MRLKLSNLWNYWLVDLLNDIFGMLFVHIITKNVLNRNYRRAQKNKNHL